jgi:hypothetical protein
MNTSTQTTDDCVQITNSPDYFPIIESSITQYINGKVIIMMNCEFDSNDYSTQTEYNEHFDYDVEMYVRSLELNDKYNGEEFL